VRYRLSISGRGEAGTRDLLPFRSQDNENSRDDMRNRKLVHDERRRELGHRIDASVELTPVF